MSDKQKFLLLPKAPAPDAQIVYSRVEDKILRTIDIANTLNTQAAEIERLKGENLKLENQLEAIRINGDY